MRICVIGTGYVGLVTGTCLAQTGNNVICVDIDESKIERLNRGELPIYEPGLKEMLLENKSKGRLIFSTDIAEGVRKSTYIFIAVGTPSDIDGSADLKAVMNAAADIAKAMNGYKIIIDKSTVPVGTADKVRGIVFSLTEFEFDVVSNPEFLKEGTAVDDFMKPDRVVIGADTPKAEAMMQELYAPFLRTGYPLNVMSVRSAELTKYAANALLATKVTFMNEIASLCEKIGADVNDVRLGIGSDKRIGPRFLFPGVGFGGSCFPKDIRALIHTAKEHNSPMKILEAVNEVNMRQKKVMIEKVLNHFQGNIKGLTFGIWGLAFKPKTDDMREAPSIDIINGLLEKGAEIKAYDPKSLENAKSIFRDRITYVEDQYEVLKDADALILITEWNEFREPDFESMRNIMKKPVIFDGRNILSVQKVKEMGFKHYCIGRPNVEKQSNNG
ncbi:UDP-glucose/GDP-mannose dehydrogenase family protein [bacterium]|nr:UDP-glucose/GDP-mannose dehydrogenase family protein [FCB group bacterium]MBL7191306.1 UDP-glucose/GDP-mannose dehydrogenase family protein [bacterium]